MSTLFSNQLKKQSVKFVSTKSISHEFYLIVLYDVSNANLLISVPKYIAGSFKSNYRLLMTTPLPTLKVIIF